MSIRKRDVHFSDWTKVRHALVCNNIQGITETSSFDEVRAFLINSESGSNPFYYYVCYIKETKEIYTHGQFYDCSKYDDSAILQKIDELESTLYTKVDLTVFEELQSEVNENELVTARALTELNEKKADTDDLNSAVLSLRSSINTKANQSDLDVLSENLNTLSAEVEENEDVTAAALTELHENKADKTDLENLSVEVYENEEITAAALADIYEKLDNVALPDMSNYALKTDLATKQDVISDLDDIRSGASLGATSIQNVDDLATYEDLNAVNQAKLDIETYNTDKTNTDSRISTLEGKTNLSDFTDDLTRGYTSVDHGTSDTTFALTPNVYHIWGEVTSLTLTFDTEVSGFANEYLIQFTSGTTATTLSLPDTVK